MEDKEKQQEDTLDKETDGEMKKQEELIL